MVMVVRGTKTKPPANPFKKLGMATDHMEMPRLMWLNRKLE